MSLAVFTEAGVAPILEAGFAWRPITDDVENEFGPGHSQRVSRTAGRIFREFTVPFRCSVDEADRLEAFFDPLGWTTTSFLFLAPPYGPPREHRRLAGVLSETSDGARLVFTVRAFGLEGGDYPLGNPRLYRAGVLQTAGVLSVQTEARTITTTVAPAAGGAAMTADYDYGRRVVARDIGAWERLGEGALFERTMVWREVNE